MKEFEELEATLGGGTLGIAARFEEETTLHNAEMLFPTASCIKIAIVEEVFRQGLDLDHPVTVERGDIVGGSGVLSTLTPPLTLPLRDLVTLAISVSDNTASNLCLRAVGGPDAVNALLRSRGARHTQIHRPIKFGLEPGDPPHTATGTPADFLTLLETLSEPTRRVMALCTGEDMLPRYLPVNPFADELGVAAPDLTVAHKTGAVEGVRNDVGYVVRGGKILTLAIFTRDVPDPRWTPENTACLAVARAARLLCERFL